MQRVNTPVRRSAAAQSRLVVVREALLAVCEGQWEQARGALTRQPELTRRDPVLLNLLGVVCQASGQWTQARRYYGRAMRKDRHYAPATDNMRRLYELCTLGSAGRIRLGDERPALAMLLRQRSVYNR